MIEQLKESWHKVQRIIRPVSRRAPADELLAVDLVDRTLVS
jgi:hypothetical protein